MKKVLNPLFCCVISPLVGAQEARLGDKIRPLKQAVYLQLDPAVERFSGSTEIVLKVDKPTPVVRFNRLDITVGKAELVRATTTLQLTPGKNSIISASAGQPIAAGSYRLRLEFDGPYNRQSVGLYKYTNVGDRLFEHSL